MELAVRKLKTKDRYEAEVRSFLSEFDEDTVERVIRFLIDRRIIDDTKTTQNLTERNTGKRLVSLEKLRAELLERGAPEETLDAVIGQDFENKCSGMLDLLARKFSPTDSRAKAARFLYSRGFSEEEIESVLDRFFKE